MPPYGLYDEYDQGRMIDVCEQTCRNKINTLITDGTNNGKDVTQITFECCAELVATISKVNPIMMAAGDPQFIMRIFNKVYSMIVERINS